MNKKTEKMEMVPRTLEANPFQLMQRFTKDMGRLFEDFQGFNFPTFFNTDFAPFRTEFARFEWMPEIEILKKNGTFTVKADLPGLTKDDVKIELTEEFLTISGERKEEKEEKGEGFYRTERSYGSFYRQIPLPEGAETEKATATFQNGVLEITVPAVKAEKKTYKLEIKEPSQVKAAKATA